MMNTRAQLAALLQPEFGIDGPPHAFRKATMEEAQAFENQVLEKLNAGKTVRSFLIAAVELLAEALNVLVVQVFRKDDYAVKYAVEPLLSGSGPLGELSVRLKLMYGLGVISPRI